MKSKGLVNAKVHAVPVSLKQFKTILLMKVMNEGPDLRLRAFF